MKNTASNVKSIGGLPSLVNDLKDTIVNALKELQGAAGEIAKASPVDVRTKCQAKKLTTAVQCHAECGAAVKASAEDKKAWEAAQKKKKKPVKAKQAAK